MKATILAILMSMFGFYLQAQEETPVEQPQPQNQTQEPPAVQKTEKPDDGYQMKTLLGNKKKLAHGGYMGFSVLGSEINDESALLVGGRLAWVMDHKLAIGFAGYGLTNSITVNTVNSSSDISEFGMGYGGLLIEPIIGSRQPIHVSFPVIIGAGGAGFFDNGVRYYDPDNQVWESSRNDGDAFFVVEPGIDVELNVVKYFRFAVGASYRYVDQLSLDGLEAEDLSGFSAGITLKLGFF